MSMPQGKNPITDHDIYLFKEGNHFRLYDKLGAHAVDRGQDKGTYFAVWAPAAHSVSVIGDFNGWKVDKDHLHVRWDGSGIWEGFVPGVEKGALYKFHVASRYYEYKIDKSDPFAFSCEKPPKTASVVWDLEYTWGDSQWMHNRLGKNDCCLYRPG